MNLIKKNYFLTIFLVLSIVFIMTTVIINLQAEKRDYQITIEHGDSLWKLADRFGSGKPKETWINQVMEINNLHSAHIKVGDVLTIPSGNASLHLDNSTELAGEGQ